MGLIKASKSYATSKRLGTAALDLPITWDEPSFIRVELGGWPLAWRYLTAQVFIQLALTYAVYRLMDRRGWSKC